VKRTTNKIALLTAILMLTALCVPMAEAEPIAKTGGKTIHFSQYDFTSVLNDEDRELAGIVIAELPAGGVLMFAGRALYEGEAVTAETLGALSYEPPLRGSGTAEFSFLPVYADGAVDELMTVSLTMQGMDNHPPMAQDIETKTIKNVAATGLFRAVDPEGDALTFRLTSKPRRGEVEVLPDGRFIYTPFRNKTGSDTFTFVAVDAYGNVSKEAKARITIEKPSTKTTYADMDGHPARYAAMRLCGDGVYTGRQIDGHYYFGPDEPVSRAEMITMIVRALGLELTPVAATGFHDDADMPDWFKPYAQAALKAGIISGVRSPDGRTVFNPHELVTLSQAASMLNKALRPANVTLDPMATAAAGRENMSATAGGVVPAWSAQAIANLDAAGILDDMTAASGDRALTRGEVAMMLVRAMDAMGSVKEKSGLLSWVFGW